MLQVHSQMLVDNDTVYVCIDGYNYYSTVNFNYEYETRAFDGWVVLESNCDSIDFSVRFFCLRELALSPMLGYIDIWSGTPSSGSLIVNHFSGSTMNTTVHALEGRITLHLHYNADSLNTSYPMQRQLNIQWNPSSDCQFPSYSHGTVTTTYVTSNEAIVKWYGYSPSVNVRYNGQDHPVLGDSLHLTGLSPDTRYYVGVSELGDSISPCQRTYTSFYTTPLAHSGCPNVLDLNSNYVRCFYGKFHNPNDRVGVVNRGPGQLTSRHTVHRNPNEHDPVVGSDLLTVPPGLPGSIKLGNALSGGEAESVVYYLHVDTMLYSLIILHYAVVLQDPNHPNYLQPRFVMEILDDHDSVIDAQCGAADFRANASLGWNSAPDLVLWKDWTTVGINLAPYHGQDVRLKFTTYDCAEGGHFGYAYFYAECHQPFASAELCGNVDTNTFVAPDGFNYLWYFDNVSNPVSTEQSVTYPTTTGTIHCRLSFIENPACYVTMDTYVGNYWPDAVIDTLFTVDRGCDGYEVHFFNRSTILGNDSLPQPGNPPCEVAHWNFGDGSSSSEYNPTHTYRFPGTYTVTLEASIAGNTCHDTAQITIVAPDVWATSDQYLTCCDSLLWLDSLWYSHDTVGPTVRVHFFFCDTIYTLHLTTLSSHQHYLPADTFCYSNEYLWRNQTVPISPNLFDTLFHLLSDTLVAANGCDSIDYLPLIQLPPDPLSIGIEPDCGMGFYLLTANTDNPFWLWSSEPHDSLLDGHESDRQLGVFPNTTITYYLTSYYGDSLFCPTTTAIHLSPPTFPRAELEVNPTVLTYEKSTLYAYDRGSKYNHRRWSIVNHGATHDTISLPDTLQRIEYPVQLDFDSVTVILDVNNNFCHDTASQTLPIVRSALYAPNVFIPDADRNNSFTVVCNGIVEAELTLYNRQGLFVYSTHDLAQGWDGTHNGTPCPQGAYVWHLRYRTLDRPEQWNVQTGTVTLLR